MCILQIEPVLQLQVWEITYSKALQNTSWSNKLTKSKKLIKLHYSMLWKVKFFAKLSSMPRLNKKGSNDGSLSQVMTSIDNLQPLWYWFMELHLRGYLYEDFVEIVRRIIKTKYWVNENLSEKIAYDVLNQLKSKIWPDDGSGETRV